MFKKGDIVSIKGVPDGKTLRVTASYDYGDSQRRAKELGYPIASSLLCNVLEGEVKEDERDGRALVMYSDPHNHKGVLLFTSDHLVLVRVSDATVNNYQIY